MSDDGASCAHCGEAREVTSRTQGVWATCDYCDADWWCIAAERDWMDEVTAVACSGGCNDGWGCDCGDETDWDEEP